MSYIKINSSEINIINKDAADKRTGFCIKGNLKSNGDPVVAKISGDCLNNREQGFFIGYLLDSTGAWMTLILFSSDEVNWKNIEEYY